MSIPFYFPQNINELHWVTWRESWGFHFSIQFT